MLLGLQGGKQEWHIATGVPFKSKKLSADEMSQMVDRLCTPKHEADNLPPKPHVSLSPEQPSTVTCNINQTATRCAVAGPFKLDLPRLAVDP